MLKHVDEKALLSMALEEYTFPYQHGFERIHLWWVLRDKVSLNTLLGFHSWQASQADVLRSHERLQRRLHSQGIRGQVLSWIMNWQRTWRVSMGNFLNGEK